MCLKIQMFGRFSITWQDRKIRLGKSQTTKALRLLQMLLHAGPEGLSRDQIMDYLYDQDMEGDIANNLRVVVHNLRRMLEKLELPDESYIVLESGRYRFESSFPVKVDALEFAAKVKEAAACADAERLALLEEACDLYGGAFLPALAGEEWVVVADTAYRRMYFSAMEELSGMLKERKAYELLLKYCRKASALYPFDEWQIWQIDCLMELGRPRDAMKVYEETTALYFDELGLSPSPEMMERFQRMGELIRLNTSHFTEIQRNLREQSNEGGAYYCSYPSFVASYQMIARLMERSGQSIYLMICTLSDEKGKLDEDPQRLKAVSDKLLESIREALRRGDVFTRYSMRQFLVILTGITREECPITSNRIDAVFRRKESSRKIRVSYQAVSVASGLLEGDGDHFSL